MHTTTTTSRRDEMSTEPATTSSKSVRPFACDTACFHSLQSARFESGQRLPHCQKTASSTRRRAQPSYTSTVANTAHTEASSVAGHSCSIPTFHPSSHPKSVPSTGNTLRRNRPQTKSPPANGRFQIKTLQLPRTPLRMPYMRSSDCRSKGFPSTTSPR